MSFDDAIDKILKEAYFSSPYEKMTGIKRQVNIQTEENYDDVAAPGDFRDDISFDGEEPEQGDEIDQLSPQEKEQLMIDITREINNTPIETDPEETEFRQSKNRKMATIDGASDVVIHVYNTYPDDHGMDMPKKELANYAIATLAHHPHRTEGDEFTLDDIKKYFIAIKKGTGIMPMSTERYRNIERDALTKLKGLLGQRANQKKDLGDIETDPEKIAAAQARLRASLQSSRSSETYR